jgi:hypothetical protein
LDYEMPLVPNQVGEAAVEIARSGRFHGNSLARASSPSCEGRRRPVGARSSHGCFPPPGCAPAHGRARRTGREAASLAAALVATGFWQKAVKRKSMRAKNSSGSSSLFIGRCVPRSPSSAPFPVKAGF